jgi:hypothetical protein
MQGKLPDVCIDPEQLNQIAPLIRLGLGGYSKQLQVGAA